MAELDFLSTVHKVRDLFHHDKDICVNIIDICICSNAKAVKQETIKQKGGGAHTPVIGYNFFLILFDSISLHHISF